MYAETAEIIWKNGKMFKPIIAKSGVFHTLCNIIAIIEKQFKYAGVRDLAVESCITDEGSVDAVLDRRKYNRDVGCTSLSMRS